MPKSDFAEQLDAIQAQVTAFLKPFGFRKKGRTHNRTTEAGLVQVVNFQMGEYPIGEHYVIPGIRESYYGKFAVNLGVLLPCVREVEWQKPAPDFVQEHYCTIRSRLGSLAYGTDHWFDLTRNTSTLAATLVQLFDKFGLPFLDQFPDYASALAYFDEHGNLPFQNSKRASLEAAIVAHHLGDSQRAQHLFERAHSTDHKGFRKHVSTLANRLGHQVA
jgi:hypothetical protein